MNNLPYMAFWAVSTAIEGVRWLIWGPRESAELKLLRQQQKEIETLRNEVHVVNLKLYKLKQPQRFVDWDDDDTVCSNDKG